MGLVTVSAHTAREARTRQAEKIRWVFLVLAALWMLVVVVVVATYHLSAGPPTIWKSVCPTPDRCVNYFTHPRALSLLERDPVSGAFVLGAMAVGVLVGFADAMMAARSRQGSSGVASIIAGVLVVLFSMFGLLYGIASIGLVGLLIVLSGLEGRKVTQAGSSAARSIST